MTHLLHVSRLPQNSHNVIKQLHDCFFLKKDVVIKFFIIIYNYLLESTQYTSLSAPHEEGFLVLRENYAHVIPSPIGCS